MPIPTNSNFDAKNLELTKRPLYLLTIEGVLEPLTTFRLEDVQITRHGYGIGGYGVMGYGY
jgi:hypothetical protein